MAERTIAESQRIYAETGHLYEPLLDAFYKEAMKRGEPFEIVTPGYYEAKQPEPPREAKKPFWKFW